MEIVSARERGRSGSSSGGLGAGGGQGESELQLQRRRITDRRKLLLQRLEEVRMGAVQFGTACMHLLRWLAVVQALSLAWQVAAHSADRSAGLNAFLCVPSGAQDTRGAARGTAAVGQTAGVGCSRVASRT